MSDRPPPRRPSSLEMTAVIPREGLSVRSLPDVPEPSIEELAERERARRDAQDAVETLVPCPRCRCPLGGVHMVSAAAAARWRAEHPNDNHDPEAA